MKYLTDLHIHTLASGHAYSTIDENIKYAKANGIKVMAMTDHSSGMPGGPHEFHFMNLKVIPKEVYGVRVLKGVEANIIDFDGNIDMGAEVLEGLDMAIASLHPPCIPFADEETITRAVEKAMENPYVKILGHPGDQRYPINPERLVLASKRTGTLIEINNASLKPQSFRPGVRESLIDILKYCKQYEVPVVVNTDAHICYEVGVFEESLAFLAEQQFPEHLILNTNPERLLQILGCND
ncbi:MAG: phosphatase [Cellulosilyticaceae bacterium]